MDGEGQDAREKNVEFQQGLQLNALDSFPIVRYFAG
jgi:hypothetical protein